MEKTTNINKALYLGLVFLNVILTMMAVSFKTYLAYLPNLYETFSGSSLPMGVISELSSCIPLIVGIVLYSRFSQYTIFYMMIVLPVVLIVLDGFLSLGFLFSRMGFGYFFVGPVLIASWKIMAIYGYAHLVFHLIPFRRALWFFLISFFLSTYITGIFSIGIMYVVANINILLLTLLTLAILTYELIYRYGIKDEDKTVLKTETVSLFNREALRKIFTDRGFWLIIFITVLICMIEDLFKYGLQDARSLIDGVNWADPRVFASAAVGIPSLKAMLLYSPVVFIIALILFVNLGWTRSMMTMISLLALLGVGLSLLTPEMFEPGSFSSSPYFIAYSISDILPAFLLIGVKMAFVPMDRQIRINGWMISYFAAGKIMVPLIFILLQCTGIFDNPEVTPLMSLDPRIAFIAALILLPAVCALGNRLKELNS